MISFGLDDLINRGAPLSLSPISVSYALIKGFVISCPALVDTLVRLAGKPFYLFETSNWMAKG
jgi:hypothetical protein